ncbi:MULTISPECIES: type II toxin-antitoxin system RelE family toxin [Streptomyces]
MRRVHAGRYRVLYEIKDAEVTVIVIHLGRLG